MKLNPSAPPEEKLYPTNYQETGTTQKGPIQTPEWHKYIFMSINGYILAFNASEQYKQVWKTSLTGTGWNQTSLALDPGSGSLFVTCGKLAHCLDASNGNLVWKTKIKAKYCYLQIIPEGLVIGGNGYVQLLDTKSGSVIYITSLTGGGYTITSIAVVNDTIYASNSGTIYAVDRKSGKLLPWKVKLGASTAANTLIYHDNVLTSGRSSYLTIVNLSTAIVSRDTRNSLGDSNVSLLWRNPKMLLSGVDSSIKARDPLTHNEIWKNGLKGTGISRGVSMAQNDKYVFAGTNGYALCLDPDSGDTKWNVGLSGSGLGNFVSLLVKNDKLIAGCNGMGYALDISTGKIDWKMDLKCGSGHISIVDVNTPIMDYNAQPMLHVIEKIKEEDFLTVAVI